jgi:hypothetical protein
VFVLSLEAGRPVDWHGHRYPFHTVPEVECHIAPPFLAINGGAKCSAVNLNAIVAQYESSNLPPALEGRLDLLRQIWELIQNAKEEADSWRKNSTKGKRKREQDDDDIERLSRSTRLTTRSQSRILHRHGDDVGYRRKRKAPPSSCGTTLTKRAVLHFSKRQKHSDFRAMVRRWAESIDKSAPMPGQQPQGQPTVTIQQPAQQVTPPFIQYPPSGVIQFGIGGRLPVHPGEDTLLLQLQSNSNLSNP